MSLVFAFSFAACSKNQDGKKTDTKKDGETAADEVKYNEKWVVEPTIEADNIYSLPIIKYNKSTHHYDLTYGDAYVIEKDGKFGLIDSNGKTVVEIKYDSIETCFCSRRYIAYLKEDGETYSIDSNFETEWRGPHKCEKFEGKTYIWETSSNSIQAIEISDGEQEKSDDEAYLPETVEIYENDKATGKYSLAYSGRLLTQEKFENAGLYTGGIAAFCKNGKWGYIDSTGKQVIPFQYDAIDGHDIIGRGNTAYECSEGYVTVLKDGKWGIIRADGQSVIPCTYSSLTTVHDGRAFALGGNGLWGILCVDEAVSNGIAFEKTTEEETTEETTSQEDSDEDTNEENEDESADEDEENNSDSDGE